MGVPARPPSTRYRPAGAPSIPARRRGRDVIHVVARNLEDFSPMLGRLKTESRNFI